MRKVRYFTSGYCVYEIEENPCGCHPYDIIKTTVPYGSNKKVSVSLSFKNGYDRGAYYRAMRWVELK